MVVLCYFLFCNKNELANFELGLTEFKKLPLTGTKNDCHCQWHVVHAACCDFTSAQLHLGQWSSVLSDYYGPWLHLYRIDSRDMIIALYTAYSGAVSAACGVSSAVWNFSPEMLTSRPVSYFIFLHYSLSAVWIFNWRDKTASFWRVFLFHTSNLRMQLLHRRKKSFSRTLW